ncbi:MAG: ABC transporter permease [Planctomycetes bacterium]|nr:ABC transporter permease [Planctomycetota bacterium]
MQFWALIVDAFRESRDRKIFWVLVVMTFVIVACMLCIGFEQDRVTFLFGAWEVEGAYYSPLSAIGRSHIIGLAVYLLVPVFLGWIGVILMIVATANMFPNLMERGAVDVLLAKPLGRPRLFLYKYLAGMTFVLFQAALFVGSTFLVLGFRWRVWVPGYLLCIPLLVLLFSYLYCVSVLVAVRTRSAVAATLVTLFAWVLFAAPAIALDTYEQFPGMKQDNRMYRTLRTVARIMPKTRDIPYLAARWTNAGVSMDIFPRTVMEAGLDEEKRAQLERAREKEHDELAKNPAFSIGSSLLFEAAVVVCAMWMFNRRDF